MKNFKEYKSAGDWFLDARKNGYSAPGAMCNELNIAQRELNLPFAEVFELFINNGIILESNRCYIYNMKGHLDIKDYGNIKKRN